jgi:hypothetical protein
VNGVPEADYHAAKRWIRSLQQRYKQTLVDWNNVLKAIEAVGDRKRKDEEEEEVARRGDASVSEAVQS